MSVLRTGGQLTLAWVFFSSGLDVLRHPEKPTETAGWLFGAARDAMPVPVPPDVHLVRANAAVQIAAGTLLATGRATRPSAAVLAGSLVPTTIAGHAFWRFEDPVLQKAQRVQFRKNLGLLGGLLIASDPADTARRTSSRFRTAA